MFASACSGAGRVAWTVGSLRRDVDGEIGFWRGSGCMPCCASSAPSTDVSGISGLHHAVRRTPAPLVLAPARSGVACPISHVFSVGARIISAKFGAASAASGVGSDRFRGVCRAAILPGIRKACPRRAIGIGDAQRRRQDKTIPGDRSRRGVGVAIRFRPGRTRLFPATRRRMEDSTSSMSPTDFAGSGIVFTPYRLRHRIRVQDSPDIPSGLSTSPPKGTEGVPRPRRE